MGLREPSDGPAQPLQLPLLAVRWAPGHLYKVGVVRESPRLGLSSALNGFCALGVLGNEASVWGPISTGKLHSGVVDGKTQTLADRNTQETVSLLQSPLRF